MSIADLPAVDRRLLVEEDRHQTRVAVLEDDRVVELFIERRTERGVVGNLYKGRVHRVLPGMQAAFVDIGLERDAFLYVSDVRDEELELAEDRSAAEAPTISDLLRPGQEVLVQVVKEPLPAKGARVTTQITLPGRYLVLMPYVGHLGVSRRIEEEPERERLRAVLEELPVASGGVIARTAAWGHERAELETDLGYLEARWQEIRERAHLVSAPTLIHRDLDLTLRVVRDLLDRSFKVAFVEGEEAFRRTSDFVRSVDPELASRVRLFEEEGRLFDHFEVEEAITEALRSKVWLKSGGYLVIHPTEALVAIDVNTGRFVGRRNLEETVLLTNLEAVKEVVRQIRVRNLSGIIVVDLIDMVEPGHREQVFAALERELAKDRSRTRMLEISEFGLVEITRKRSRPSLERVLTSPCPYCEGRGRIRSLATLCLEVRRKVLDEHRRRPEATLVLRVHPDLAGALQREEGAVLEELDHLLQGRLLVQSDRSLHHEQIELVEV